ncbi:MAG: AraC family transcriptional regulator [Oscillospiraceae bacterium]|nr:AraC family transcriptional regulator [Oscillospiraceae bacterium]
MAFFEEYDFKAMFPPDEDFGINVIGYNNFEYIKPVKYKWIQNHYTLHYVLDGSGRLFIEDREFKVKKGDLFFIEPKIPMMYFPNEDDPWEYVWFNFNGKKAERYGKEMGFSRENAVKSINEQAKVVKMLDSLLKALKTPQGSEYFLALSVFYEIMHLSTEAPILKGAENAVRIIDNSFTEPNIDIDTLCSSLNISHSHLCRLFKEQYGTTMIKYIVKKRLELSKKLLRSTELSINSIANSCGFTDEIHFMKSFKKEFLMTPSQYRVKKREN